MTVYKVKVPGIRPIKALSGKLRQGKSMQCWWSKWLGHLPRSQEVRVQVPSGAHLFLALFASKE